MRQYKLCIQIIIIIKKRIEIKNGEQTGTEGESVEREEEFVFKIFSSLRFFLRFTKIGP